MADLYPVAGCRIYIGGVVQSQAADFVEGDFSGQSWIEIDGWETMGVAGDASALITVPLINRSRDVKLKGTANAGQMQNNFASLPDDPGQIALLAAAQPSNKDNYAFRVDLSDVPPPGTPSKRFFIGLVMAGQEQGGGANTAQLMSATVEINSNIVRVPAP